jgi:DNA-binding NtrC family response regulator
MDKPHTILVADRNAHVREFLKRELMAEGYDIRLAKCGREVLNGAYHLHPLDLIILDLDLPDIEEESFFSKLQERIPAVPIVIHSFQSDGVKSSVNYEHLVFLEKNGDSIERMKKVVKDILSSRKTGQPYPLHKGGGSEAIHSKR